MRRPADRIALVREQIRILREEEASIRQGLVDGTLPLEGANYTVTIEHKVSERIDARAMREQVPEEIWRPFVIATSTAYVKTTKKS